MKYILKYPNKKLLKCRTGAYDAGLFVRVGNFVGRQCEASDLAGVGKVCVLFVRKHTMQNVSEN